MVLALQRPSSLRTGHFLLPRCPDALRLSNVPFLGGHTTPHAWPLCHLSSSSGIFWSFIFFQSPSSVLRVRFSFSTLWCMGQGQNMAPWRWSEQSEEVVFFINLWFVWHSRGICTSKLNGKLPGKPRKGREEMVFRAVLCGNSGLVLWDGR